MLKIKFSNLLIIMKLSTSLPNDEAHSLYLKHRILDAKRSLFRALKLSSLAEVDRGTQSRHLGLDIKAKQPERRNNIWFSLRP
jgi:hypothetical protein